MTSPPLVLHVDDDASIREVVRLMLEGLGGMQVQSVDGGPAAVELVSRTRPDVVLLDVMMPGMDGPETLARLRAVEGCAELPVIFLTAKVMRGEMRLLEGLGAAKIIQKPFRARELLDAIAGVLAPAQGAR